jgi:hypothetical protein
VSDLDPYQVLGVPRWATREHIERAFRSLAMKVHPDRRGGNTRRMAQLNAARELLTAKLAQFEDPDLDGIKRLAASVPVQELHRLRSETIEKIRQFTQRDCRGHFGGPLNSPLLVRYRKELKFLEAQLA